MAGKEGARLGNKESGRETRRVAGNQGEWLETGYWLGNEESGWKTGRLVCETSRVTEKRASTVGIKHKRGSWYPSKAAGKQACLRLRGLG